MVNGADRTSFEEHFDGLYRVAYRVAYRILGSRPDAQDAAQEAMVRACMAWRRIEGNGEAWVATVASGRAIDMWRRQRRAPQFELRPGAVATETIDDRFTLVKALRSLPRRQREVVVLRYVADLPERAVAEALGCSAGSVKQHASRGLVALRSQLGDAPSEREEVGDDVRPLG